MFEIGDKVEVTPETAYEHLKPGQYTIKAVDIDRKQTIVYIATGPGRLGDGHFAWRFRKMTEKSSQPKNTIFSVGQKVICKNASGQRLLKEGQIYTVSFLRYDHNEEPRIALVGVGPNENATFFYASRFDPVNEVEEKKMKVYAEYSAILQKEINKEVVAYVKSCAIRKKELPATALRRWPSDQMLVAIALNELK